jgi:hypothetical protein
MKGKKICIWWIWNSTQVWESLLLLYLEFSRRWITFITNVRMSALYLIPEIFKSFPNLFILLNQVEQFINMLGAYVKWRFWIYCFIMLTFKWHFFFSFFCYDLDIACIPWCSFCGNRVAYLYEIFLL